MIPPWIDHSKMDEKELNTFEDAIGIALSNCDNSPDQPTIMKKKCHLLFTYGTLKHRQSRASTLKDSAFIGNAITCFKNYSMYHYKPKSFPVVMHEPAKSSRAAKILGELYMVTPDTVSMLDYIESNGEQYVRTPIFVALTSKHYHKAPVLKAIAYIGKRDFWQEDIPESLVPMPIMSGNKTEMVSNFYVW